MTMGNDLSDKQTSLFVKISGFRGLTTTLYQTGFALYLWLVFGQHNLAGDSKGLIAWLLSGMFLLEFFCDFASSYIIDMRRGRRELVFASGFAIQLFQFLLLAAGPWIIAMESTLDSTLSVSVFALLIMFLGTLSNALISGTFDGWVVSALKSASQETQMHKVFAHALLLQQRGAFIGVLAACLAAVAQSWFTNSNDTLFYTALWLFAFSLQGYLLIILWRGLREIEALQKTEKKDTASRRQDLLSIKNFIQAIRAAFVLEQIPALMLKAGMFAMSMLLMFTWPVVVKGWSFEGFGQHVKWFYAAVILAVSMLGAKLARSLATKDADGSKIRHQGERFCYLACAAFAGAGAAVLFLHDSEATSNFGITLCAALLLLNVVFRFGARPFIQSMMHQQISDEALRAAVVSIRESSVNLVVTVIFLVMGSLVSGTHLSTQYALGIVFTGTALVAAANAVFVSRRFGREVMASRASGFAEEKI